MTWIATIIDGFHIFSGRYQTPATRSMLFVPQAFELVSFKSLLPSPSATITAAALNWALTHGDLDRRTGSAHQGTFSSNQLDSHKLDLPSLSLAWFKIRHGCLKKSAMVVSTTSSYLKRCY